MLSVSVFVSPLWATRSSQPVQCMLACAFQRTNAARLLLHEKTAHSVFPVDHCLKAFLSSVLPHLHTRDVLEFHLQCIKSTGLQRMLNEKRLDIRTTGKLERPSQHLGREN